MPTTLMPIPPRARRPKRDAILYTPRAGGGMSLIVDGEAVSAANTNRPHNDALTKSGYLADGSDFAGFLGLNGGTLVGPVSQTLNSSLDVPHGWHLTFNQAGGNVGFQLSHGIFLEANFTPATGTNRGLQAQKITAKIFGPNGANGGVDNASLSCLDLSAIIDASRTGKSALLVGVSSVASKWNAVDDTSAGGALIAGQFTANLNAGVTSLIPIQSSLTVAASTTASAASGVQVFAPVLGAGASVTGRAAALDLGDWSVATNAGLSGGGYAIYSLGGTARLGAGGHGQLLIGDGATLAGAFRPFQMDFVNDATIPAVYLKSNNPTGFSYFEHVNDAGKMAFFGLYGSANAGFSPGSGLSRVNLFEMYNSGGHIALNAFGATSVLYLLSNGAIGVSVGYSGGAALGFYGAAPVAKQAVAGARAGNAALQSALAALAALGLITDTTTA
jgi:hypothetical protein